MTKKATFSALLVILLVLAAMPAFGGSAVIGSVAGTMSATVGGQPALANSVVFSGDSLRVKDGATVVAINNGGRLVFGHNSEASFLRDDKEVTVLLSQGNVSMYHPDSSGAVRVKVDNLSISPATGFKTLGEVASLNGAVVVTSKMGVLRVNGNGAPVDVKPGQSITIQSKTARAPQAGTMQKLEGGNTALEAAGLAAGIVAAILAGLALSRAGDARDAANAATSAANAATSAANQADADAKAATAAAQAAQLEAMNVGCALNAFSDELYGGAGIVPSPYVPPSGSTCASTPSGAGEVVVNPL
jgi:hypothetical protein